MKECRGQDATLRPSWARLLWPHEQQAEQRAERPAELPGGRPGRVGQDGHPGAPGVGPVASPGVDAVVESLTTPDPDPDVVAHALTVLAWERAAAAHDLTCTMDDVDELWTLLEAAGAAPLPRSRARHCLVDAWVDAVAAERDSPGVDPLSGLHTSGYLYGRVHELDRVAADPPSALVLVVVRWPVADGPWRRIAQVMQVASALRACVRPEATLSQVGTSMAVALVPDDARARLERHALTKAFENGELSTAHVQVDVFAVPDVRSHLPELVTRLHEQASVDHVTGSSSSRQSGKGPLN